MADYFSHDYNSRTDPKIIQLAMKHGQAGKGIYWDLVEMLYEQNGYLSVSMIPTYAFALHTDCETITSIINDFSLFVTDGDKFFSQSVLKRIAFRNMKSDKARDSARSRWDKALTPDTNGMRTHSDGNANKGKERKGNKRKIKEFVPPIVEDVIIYFKENGYSEFGARKAFEYYRVNNWKDSQDNQVKNWKQKMIAVWFKPEYKIIEDPKLKHIIPKNYPNEASYLSDCKQHGITPLDYYKS